MAAAMKPEQEPTTHGPNGEGVAPEAPQHAGTSGQADAAAAGDDTETVDAAFEEDGPEFNTPEEMLAEIERLRATIVSQHDEVLRVQADMENLRKRSAREVENAHKFGLEKVMNELLPVRDSLELGLNAAGDEGVDVASVREGLELTLKMLDTATSKFGLESVDPTGEAFDPERHQAISMQEVAGTESGTVLNVIQKGFTLNDRLVRPAMVIVAS